MFDVEKKDLEAPDTLFALMSAPAEEWDAQYSRGKEIGMGIPEATLAGMGKAFTMARGIIPKTAWNNSVLGEVIAPSVPTPPVKAASSAVKTPHSQTAGVSQAGKDIPRPKRNVKKRAYGDSSFEGYGEGYVDDDIQETGYSTGDGEDRGGSRKRSKKVCSLLHLHCCVANDGKTTTSHSGFQQGPMRQNSYGPGMVGA
jgi:hypothetical protein